MLPQSLEMVKGAISKKDLIPVLTHIAFDKAYVHGVNGHLHICSPAPEFKTLPSLTVPAPRLLPILEALTDDVIRLSATDRTLHVRAGSFHAVIPTGDITEFPMMPPPAVGKKLKAPILPALRAVRPFVSDDAQKTWATTVMFSATHVYATNNIALIAYPIKDILGATLNGIVLPIDLIDELLRIDREPTCVSREPSAIAFLYPSGAWIRSSLSTYEWPQVAKVLEDAHKGRRRKLPLIHEGLAQAVDRLLPLCPDVTMPLIIFDDHLVLTGAGLMTGDLGGQVDLVDATLGQCGYHAKYLQLMLQHATHADFTCTPRVPFAGRDGILGVMIGAVR